MKLDLFTNAAVLDDAIRLVYQKSKDNEKLKSSSNSSEEDKESNGPEYDEDNNQLEHELKEKTQEMPTNQVF
jgi:hypothetical protein